MNRERMIGQARHIATLLGTYLVMTNSDANGLYTPENLAASAEMIAGAVLVIVSFVGSFFAKEKRG